jgi:hypothetical protein
MDSKNRITVAFQKFSKFFKSCQENNRKKKTPQFDMKVEELINEINNLYENLLKKLPLSTQEDFSEVNLEFLLKNFNSKLSYRQMGEFSDILFFVKGILLQFSDILDKNEQMEQILGEFEKKTSAQLIELENDGNDINEKKTSKKTQSVLPFEDVEWEKKWISERDALNKKTIENKAQYDLVRDDLVKKFKGKYVAFSDNSAQLISDSLNEVSKFHDKDPTAVICRVGYEEEKYGPKDVL